MSSSQSSSQSLMECPNPDCLHPNSGAGDRRCDRCQTPLQYRYLWAVGQDVDRIPIGTRVSDRYAVVTPRVWLDTQPGRSPEVPTDWPESVLPYLHLHDRALHVPRLFGFSAATGGALLLENAPIDGTGKLFPTMASIWVRISPARQVYWLWQLLSLWAPLKQQGVASSLLAPDNLRVEGWRVRLRELIADRGMQSGSSDGEHPASDTAPLLKDLAGVWQTWIDGSHQHLVQPLGQLCQMMQTATSEEDEKAIATHLNQLLLEQVAQLPLTLNVAGATVTGPKRSHNEDACYPVTLNVTDKPSYSDELLPHLGIVCDGIGGHAGGEVASQLATRSLQLQLRALLNEVKEQVEPMSPELVEQQLSAIVRVVNNLIATQNDAEGRESRQRMGTTLVTALQLPQTVAVPSGLANAHELYIMHVGDSRAYWITPRYCHLLTVDDDVAAREVRMGRSLYRDALKRPDAAALTQALGTRDADFLHPNVQRFLIHEDGLLLLCSDGLSDGNLVERSWEDITRQFFKGEITLNEAVQTWIDRASQQNGHDNISAVLLHCQVSPSYPQLISTKALTRTEDNQESELTESSRALLYDEEDSAPEPPPAIVPEPRERQPLSPWAVGFGLAVLLSVLGVIGIAFWRQVSPDSFNRTWDRLLQSQPSESGPPPESPPPQ